MTELLKEARQYKLFKAQNTLEARVCILEGFFEKNIWNLN